MQVIGIHQVELTLILLLVFVVGFGTLALRLRTPYPIVLVISGLLLSFLPGNPHFSLNPNIVFLAILPPLLFAAAFNTSWRDFRYNLVSIGFLAFGLVGFTVFGVAEVAQWILPGFDWRLGLVLGAVVSTTDAIAATSIARRLSLPRRIIDILEGESLVNDASGLLALEFTVALLVSGHTPTLAEGVGRLLYLVIGGIAVGLVLGALVHWFEHHVDDAPIEITISILTPYAAYLTADSMHTSGVLATVACGLYLGRRSAEYFSSSVRIESYAVWNTLTFMLNGIVFVLIGLQLPYVLANIKTFSIQQVVISGALFSAVVIVLRLVWIYPGAYVSYLIRRNLLHQPERMPAPRAIFVVGWTGMRGVVALAAAISLPETLANGDPFPHRNVILFLTFSVIFVTLVLQGLTLPAVIRRLGLSGEQREHCEEQEARRIVIDAALKYIEEGREQDKAEFRPIYDDLALHYRRRLAALEGQDDNDSSITPESYRRYRAIAKRIRKLEDSTAVNLRDQGRISDEVLRTLQRELDLLDARARTSELRRTADGEDGD
jgi:CPA1 family monovalent cation:H+ antiporter